MKITDETIFNPFKAATLIRVFVVIGVGLLLIGGWEVGSRRANSDGDSEVQIISEVKGGAKPPGTTGSSSTMRSSRTPKSTSTTKPPGDQKSVERNVRVWEWIEKTGKPRDPNRTWFKLGANYSQAKAGDIREDALNHFMVAWKKDDRVGWNPNVPPKFCPPESINAEVAKSDDQKSVIQSMYQCNSQIGTGILQLPTKATTFDIGFGLDGLTVALPELT
ncbi:hypothetical protein WR25_26805 [Diploscapter pachys]|uniref:Uncharacterized protein n=1 Tax=Diploscapter pachys TaxID=2018661 RepID=A0A2A2KKU9_9BILA|nr:hypothetical protein WR25_26805 [Diploscapter pachys]